MSYENILVDIDGAVAVVQINRPKVLNALNPETLTELLAAFTALEANEQVGAIILTGAGDKAFIAGADISRMPALSAMEGVQFAELGQRLTEYMELMGKPIIAAVNGFALGGGTELAMACDFIYASPKARFGQPEINLGIIPGFGGTQRLPRLIGEGRAMEWVLTGDTYKADEAYRVGLVNKVVGPDEDVLEAAKATAAKIASKGGVAVAQAKKALHRGLQVDLPSGLFIELQAFGLVCSTEDKNEGTTAFLEKRKPEFKNR